MNAQTDKIHREACDWIAKLHDAEPSPEELKALQRWMHQSPQHKAELRRMAACWEQLNVLTELAVPVDVPGWRNVSWGSLLLGALSPRIAAGAIVAVASIALVVVLWQPNDLTDSDAPPLTMYTTAIGEQQQVTLPDKSTALLNTNSQLRVVYTDEYRNVYLIKGEAHFDVMPSPGQPFRVFAGNGMVRAVGTAFSVHLKESVVEVTVTEGSVHINTIQDNLSGGVASVDPIDDLSVVSAGQSAIFDQEVESVESIETIGQLEIARKLAWQEGLLRFSGAPLEEVIEEVSRYTPLSIVILDSQLRELPIGGFFEVGKTEKMFEALEQGFGVQVEHIDANLVHLSMIKSSINER